MANMVWGCAHEKLKSIIVARYALLLYFVPSTVWLVGQQKEHLAYKMPVLQILMV